MEDEDIEEELKRLDSQIRDENLMVSALKSKDDAIRNAGASVTPDSLCAAIVDLKLESETQETTQGPGNRTSLELEAA